MILTSSSDEKLARVKKQYSNANILTANYKNPNWHEEVMRLTHGVGVDIVVENGGASSLVKSILCTRRAGTVSIVGYLGDPDPKDLKEFIPTIIDRRVNVR